MFDARLFAVGSVGLLLATAGLAAAQEVLVFDINETLSFEGLATQPEDTVLFGFDIPGFGRSGENDFEVTVDSGGFTGDGYELEFAFDLNPLTPDGGFAREEGASAGATPFAFGDPIETFSTAPFSDPPTIGAPNSLLYTQGQGLFGPVTSGIFDDLADGDTAYVGFVLTAIDSAGEAVPNSFHFGWIEVLFDDTSDGASSPLPATDVELTLVRLGIADTPNLGVFAGGGIVPAPGAAVLLAAGGLVATRRRR